MMVQAACVQTDMSLHQRLSSRIKRNALSAKLEQESIKSYQSALLALVEIVNVQTNKLWFKTATIWNASNANKVNIQAQAGNARNVHSSTLNTKTLLSDTNVSARVVLSNMVHNASQVLTTKIWSTITYPTLTLPNKLLTEVKSIKI